VLDDELTFVGESNLSSTWVGQLVVGAAGENWGLGV